MPHQFGKVDTSTTWTPCGNCGHRHMPGTPCPPTGVWLVLVLCHRCDPKTGIYCGRHRGGPAPLQAVDTIPAPLEDARQRAAGESGGEG